MQSFKSVKQAVGQNLGQYDEVTEPYASHDAAEEAAEQIAGTWEEANVIKVGKTYRVGIRSREK